MSRVLITGGTGLIGKKLTKKLIASGYEVILLTRNPKDDSIPNYYWNIENGEIDLNAVENIDHIIHLAGAGIADKRWTKKRKKVIVNSRVKSAELLFNKIKEIGIKLESFISASAVGFYGAVTSEKVFVESDSSSNDFLGDTCRLWEGAADLFNSIDVRTVKIRIGVVLARGGGALKKMLPLYKLGLGSALGSGKQYMPWIHIDDLIDIFVKAMEDKSMKGAYNAAVPDQPVYNEFARTLAAVLNKPFFMPNVPGTLLKIALGEMSNIILQGSRASSAKLLNTNFKFNFPDLTTALKNLLPGTERINSN